MSGNKKKIHLNGLREGLTTNMINFCHEYIIEWNKIDSYIKHYPTNDRKVAAVGAHNLLKKQKIQDYIDAIKNNITEEVGISKIGMLKQLKLIAYSNLPVIIEKYKSGGVDALSEGEQQCLSEFHEHSKILNGGGDDESNVKILDKQIRLKVHDKRGSIQDILKAMGWNEPDKVDLSSKDGSMTPERVVNISIDSRDINLGT